ncbi:unnamed protein product [Cladocopium goreaui]|uniref:Uncharacterized protein n=1 Tax=Cladocopium goreaui TaxID=2562237 RepID=A0A9P1DIG0_9DINO|nr:unnamed protein product [Cladocopium goreaui]
MSGKLGDKSLHGSLFMTESQFQKFRPGLEALMQLRNMDAGPAYNAFLLLRGSKALSRFASWQHQALVRLLCLSTAYDRDSGDAVCNAFDKLSNAERASLTGGLRILALRSEELEPPLFNLSDPNSIHRFCQQKLDHFDPANNKTWCQRFVVDARYYQPGGPIFLCIDGEDNPWLPSLPARHLMTCNNMVHLASGRFNALLLGLEHRYYGGRPSTAWRPSRWRT